MAIKPVNGSSLSQQPKLAALQYLIFLKKKKRCGKIKGRGRANGRKQQVYMAKENVSLTMIATEAILLTCFIDAMECREVATVDITGAFMQADRDDEEETYMKLKRGTFGILNRLNLKLYKKHVEENGKKIIYVKL